MTDTLAVIGFGVAMVCGIVAVVESRGRSWAGAGLVIGFGALLLLRLT